MWSGPQRAVLLVIAGGIFVYLAARVALQHTLIPNPQPAVGMRSRELADRLDPNSATQAELAAIPTIGDKLAGAIIEYRDRYVKAHPGKTAFIEAKDLQRVKGVGPAKMEALSAYLEFPGVEH